MKKAKLLLLSLLFISLIHAQVGINTQNPQASLHVVGDLIITETTSKSTSNDGLRPLYIDQNGYVVRSNPEQALSPISVLQTKRSIMNSETDNTLISNFNNHIPLTLSFITQDLFLNNLGMTIVNGNLKINSKGTYQINSLICFSMGAASAGNIIFINILLEKSSDNGTTWSTVVGYRPVFTINWPSGQSIPAILPSIVAELNSNDIIRLRFVRTKDTGGNSQGDTVSERFAIESAYSTPAYYLSMMRL